MPYWSSHACARGPDLAAFFVSGRVGTTRGALTLDEVQPAGKRPMDAHAWRAGLRGDVHVDDA